MQTIIDVAVPLLTVALLTAVGLDLTGGSFKRVRQQAALVLAGLIVPLFMLPLIAVALSRVFRSPADVSGALLLIAICPIGGISNTFSYLARASTALSVTLTGLSCLVAGVTVPVAARALEVMFGQRLDVVVPFRVLLIQLVLMLAVPVGIGMLVRRRWSGAADRFQPIMQRLAFVGTGLVLALIILDDPAAFFGGLSDTVPLAVAFVFCCAAVGWLTASLFTGSAQDRFTLAAEFGTRNLGVALAVAVTLMGRLEFARFAYTYFIAELPLMLVAVAVFRARQRQLAGAGTPVVAGAD
jgi:BASS family bile acid:Na+ symporter